MKETRLNNTDTASEMIIHELFMLHTHTHMQEINADLFPTDQKQSNRSTLTAQ